MKVIKFSFVILFSLLSSIVKAEGTMIATVLQAHFSKDPGIRLLVRIIDVSGGSDSPSMAVRNQCLERVNSMIVPDRTHVSQ